MNKCLSCGKDVKNKYCTVSCQNRHQNPLKFVAAKYNYKITCGGCGAKRVISMTKRQYDTGRYSKNCSHRCAAVAHNINHPSKYATVKRYCKNCNQLLSINSDNPDKLFCSHACSNKYRFSDALLRLKEGKLSNRSTIYKYLVHLYGDKCSICSIKSLWNGKFLRLIVDHKNGKANDNAPSNIRLVCPNCNSQLPTFTGRNLGNGRGSLGMRLG